MTSPATHPPTGVDADLGDAIAAGVHGPPPADLAAFEAAFVALVEAGDPEPERAWDGTMSMIGGGSAGCSDR